MSLNQEGSSYFTNIMIFFLFTPFCSGIYGHNCYDKKKIHEKNKLVLKNKTRLSELNILIVFINCLSIIVTNDLAIFVSLDLACKKYAK